MIARLTLTLMLAIAFFSFGCGSESGSNEAPSPQEVTVPDSSLAMLERMDVSGVERDLLDTLLYLWSERNVIASVQQAADMKGIELSDSVRIDLLQKLRDNQSLHPQLQLYRPWTVILTEPEKLMGQYIVSYQKQQAEFPTVAQIAEKTGLSEEQVKERLAFLARTEFLYDLGGPTEYNELGYSFGPLIGEVLFDMGLRFHTLYVENNLPFNVGCANEAFYKILRDYPNSKVRYQTVDPLTLEPVTLVFENSELVSSDPPEAIFLNGWFRGANNVFCNKQNAEAWTVQTPNISEPPYLQIKPYIEGLVKEREESGWNQTKTE